MTVPTTRVPPLWPAAAPQFTGAGLTHSGAVRERNEDSILTDPTGVLWAIADGMGGYGHGDLASDIVIDCLSRVSDEALAVPALQAQLRLANKTIFDRSQAPEMGAMGATVVALMIQNSVANIVWAGDCRAYLSRRGQLRLLTRDHTVVQDLVDQGLLGIQERDNHPESHVVTRAVGAEPEIELDTLGVPLIAGDRILMCSDGLTACMGDHEIAAHLNRRDTAEGIVQGLVAASLDAGAPDNVSVVCIFAEAG